LLTDATAKPTGRFRTDKRRCRALPFGQSSCLENDQVDAHIWPMTHLDEFLTAAEFDALEQVDEGGNHSIAKNLSDRLLELGYIKETPSGLGITSAGQMRLALGVRT
jgi:hypothetical protein